MGISTLKATRSATALAMFGTILLLIYAVHARYLPVNVVFYSALIDVLLATVVSATALLLLPYFKVLSGLERIQMVLIMMLAGYAFAISGPTVVDRSLSLYLLERIERSGGGIRQDALEDAILGQFMDEYRVLDARLTEQLESGTIMIRNGCVILTPKGRWIADWSRTIRHNFLPKHRLLLDTYSDKLTTPLASSSDAKHACH